MQEDSHLYNSFFSSFFSIFLMDIVMMARERIITIRIDRNMIVAGLLYYVFPPHQA